MAPKSLPIAFTFLFILAAAPLLTATTSSLASYEPIKDVNDPTVVELAKFAVDEHNKQDKTTLVFSKVIGGKRQVAEGVELGENKVVQAAGRYYLEILAEGDAQPYEAAVLDSTSENNARKLVSFMPKADN